MSTLLCRSRCTKRWKREADIKTHVYLPQDNLLYHDRDLTNAVDLPPLEESSRRCTGTGAFSGSSTSDKNKHKNKEEH